MVSPFPKPLTKGFQAAGGRESGPQDHFCGPGSVENATAPLKWQKLPICGRLIWLVYQFFVICVTFSPTNCS
jgi:hypothetical protein